MLSALPVAGPSPCCAQSRAAPPLQRLLPQQQCTRDPLSLISSTAGRAQPGRSVGCNIGSHRQVVCGLPSAVGPSSEIKSPPVKPRRVMLKVSGEALQGGGDFGIDPEVLRKVAAEVAVAARQGVEVAIVVGGGNYFRGINAWDGLDRATADHMGMLATCMNAICLQSALDGLGIETRVQSAIDMRQVAEPYIRRRAIRHLERRRVVIFGAGTGNPFFTTDTAAALRAAEIDADVFLKATKVDGVYDCDPMKFPEAKLHRALSYADVRAHNLAVMDETAITLCKENNIPVVVFNIGTESNITRALLGDETIGTTVNSESGSEDLSAAAVNGNGASKTPRQMAMHFGES